MKINQYFIIKISILVLFMGCLTYISAQWRVVNTNTQTNLNSITNTQSGNLFISGDDLDIIEICPDSDKVMSRVVFNPTQKKLKSVGFSKNPSHADQFGAAVGEAGTILRTTNGGKNWDPVQSGTAVNLNKIYFGCSPSTGDSWGYAVGNSSTILVTTNKGETWYKQNTPFQLDNLYSTYFVNNAEGWAVGHAGIMYHTTNSGSNWEYVHNDMSNRELHSVYFQNEDDGFVTGDSGYVWRTTSKGISWVRHNTPARKSIRDITFATPDSGYAVGDSGTVIRTIDGGNNWENVNTGESVDYNAVAIDDGGNVWIAGDSGRVITNRRLNPVSISDDGVLPKRTELLPVYPNPFNPGTNIKYSLHETSRVSLLIYDLLGRIVSTKENNILKSPGEYSIYWDASGLSNGIYIAVLQTNKYLKTQKLILLK